MRAQRVLASSLRALYATAGPASLYSAHTAPRRSLLLSSRAWYNPTDVSPALAKDIHKIITHQRLVVFLTGTPEAPQCRFTTQLVDILGQIGVPYGYFNIMEDEEVCEGLKEYSDWPTYPQVYIDGELIGGYDVIKAMMLSGELVRLLKEKQLLTSSAA